ncbi:MAG: alpha-mannosidase [Planctomycetes bacterium]|nr:alpha-mannosidase [Planctomycetota bacterium]
MLEPDGTVRLYYAAAGPDGLQADVEATDPADAAKNQRGNQMTFHCEAEERIYLVRAEKALNRLKDRYILDTVAFQAEVRVTDERIPFARRLEGQFRPIREGEKWGRDWQTGWFRLSAQAPREWAGREVIAWIEIGGEGLIYGPDGAALQGITHGSVFDWWSPRPYMPLFSAARGGEKVELWLEAAANRFNGIAPPREKDLPANDSGRFGSYAGEVYHLAIAAVDRAAWDLRWDMDVLFDIYRNLPSGSVRRARILRALTRCAEVLAKDERAYAAGRAELADALARRANASDVSVIAVGHAHIDTAYLWPMEESIRKTARTFATQLALIERYPGYVFGASSALHYLWMKARHPDIYGRVKKAVAAGRWEIQGGMWIEPDCNMPSGESLVRQFLHGKNFFRDEFGVDVDNLWTPDTFGFAASLPQIMAGCGATSFVTQKLSWHTINEFPFHSFWWRGIDGTKVLAHFPPENTYSGRLEPGSLIRAQERFRDKAAADEMMSLFGVGDGGGGPLPEFIERGLRMKDLEGCPPVRFGTVRDFFGRLRKCGDGLNTWAGELYLEAHRGVFTTQACVKKCNRRLEQRLRELEMLWASAPLSQYPAAEFDAVWKEVLTLQFHDILPGSSIRKVYEETNAAHERLLARCDRLQESFGIAHLPAEADCATFFNSLCEEFVGAVRLPDSFAGRAAVYSDGRAAPTQIEDGAGVALIRIPAQGFATLRPSKQPAAACAPNSPVLENELVRYEFADDGTLRSAREKQAGREALSGPGNVMSLYHDRPNLADAWDVDKFYRNERLADVRFAVEPLGSGPVRSRLRLSAKIGDSTIMQIVSLEAGSRRLDFLTTVDWRERHRMLRVAFPAAINAERAGCEIPFGHLFRPTHQNTSWDMAKFEVPAHRWADVSEPGFGLALLNDCKYGYRLPGNVLDLNLLRSPTYPDPDADQGSHTFTYSLLPHAGDMLAGGVRREAGLLNQRPAVFAGRGSPNLKMAATASGDGADLAAVKRAEKDDCLVIRLIETRGARSAATVRLARPARLVETDLMEWKDGPASPIAAEHRVELKPFEIRTFKIR